VPSFPGQSMTLAEFMERLRRCVQITSVTIESLLTGGQEGSRLVVRFSDSSCRTLVISARGVGDLLRAGVIHGALAQCGLRRRSGKCAACGALCTNTCPFYKSLN
jgi:hypothetical protein